MLSGCDCTDEVKRVSMQQAGSPDSGLPARDFQIACRPSAQLAIVPPARSPSHP
jgi:hypothetical protein